MKLMLYILLVVVMLTTLVLGIGTAAPELDVTGDFVAGGNLGLGFIIVVVAAYTVVSLSKRLS